MCRRYSLTQKDKNLFHSLDGFEEILFAPESIQPGLKGAVIYKDKENWHIHNMTFGFFAHGKYIYNAKSETIIEKPLFKDAFLSHRCVVPCSFFEEADKYGHSHSFYEKENKVIYLAGIYDHDGFVLLTEKPNEEVSFYHPRMPLCLEKKDIPVYLNIKNGTEVFKTLKKPDLVSPDSSAQISLF